MRRMLTTVVVVFGCMSMLQAQSQTTESKTKIKTDDAKTMTFSGCVQTGTEARTYILQNVVPVRTTTEAVGTGGTMTTTSYALVPEKVRAAGACRSQGRGDRRGDSGGEGRREDRDENEDRRYGREDQDGNR